jgi:cardiolipin synthase
MRNRSPKRTSIENRSTIRHLADQAFSRAAGAPLIQGNSVRLLKDATENYPAWLEAIRSAEKTIHFESYIIHDDEVGAEFARVLADKAAEGVRVRLIYDWMGGLGKTSSRFWSRLSEAGVEVRCFNPPRIDSPFGWLSRDHRKMISVDGRVGFVSGLCVGRMWVGKPDEGLDGWRDTGVEVRGPAVADIENSFAQMWAQVGPPVPETELPVAGEIPPAGDVALRVVASLPYTAGLYRLDQLIAAMARKSLWLTDAYFAGTSAYTNALRAAALDGVDVRLLVPGGTDIPILRPLSQAGYRPLLEAGIRVFEWNGPMLHAKTAVADGMWARVGSTNLNLTSWVGNCELDVAVEDREFAEAMEDMYIDDLVNSTEIVIITRQRVRAIGPKRGRRRLLKRSAGSAGRAVAGALRLGNTVGAAITNRRALGPAEAGIMLRVSLLLAGLAVVSVLWPRVVTVPLAILGIWVAGSMLVRGFRLYRDRRREAELEPESLPAAGVDDEQTEAGSDESQEVTAGIGGISGDPGPEESAAAGDSGTGVMKSGT